MTIHLHNKETSEWWFEGRKRWKHINLSLLYFKIIFFTVISLCNFSSKEGKDHKASWDSLKTFSLEKKKKTVLRMTKNKFPYKRGYQGKRPHCPDEWDIIRFFYV